MNCNTCKCNKVCDHNKYGFENCNNYISADVVEVVRCKNCMHSSFLHSLGRYMCRKGCGATRTGDDFCGYGERSDT